MGDDWKYVASFVLLAVSFMTVFATPFSPNIGGEITESETTKVDAETRVDYTGNTEVTHWRDYDDDGEMDENEILMQEREPNLIVDQGLDFLLGAGGYDNLLPAGASDTDDAVFIAIANESSPQAADTALQGEITTGGLARAEGTKIVLGTGNYSVWNTFTANSCSKTFKNVNMTGLFWNNTAGSASLVAENSFTAVDLQCSTQDKLTINWTEISLTNAP